MENDILDSLDDLRYAGPLLEDGALESALEGGAESVEYTQLVSWLTTELRGLTGIEEHVNAIPDSSESGTFLLELSGFLREFGCPHEDLSAGPISQRLSSRETRLLLLDYLSTELQACRMVTQNKPNTLIGKSKSSAMQVDSQESDVAKDMKVMLIALGFPKPPAGITPFQLFSKIENKIKELVSKVPANHMSKPLLKARLSDKQWLMLESINNELAKEYELRKDVLLKRLDVTIQSFKWSDKAKKKDNEVASVYQPIRKQLSTQTNVSFAALLSAREDLLNIQKTSSGTARERTRCDINKVMIGRVPDRGGRALEHEIPPPEMPFFQQRQAGGGPQPQRQHSGRGGRGGRGGGPHPSGDGGRGGGDRVQSGWSGGDSRPQSGGQRGGGGGRGGRGGGGNWGQNTQAYSAPQAYQQQTGAAGFFGGAAPAGAQQYAMGGGGGGYQMQGYQQQQQQGGYQSHMGGGGYQGGRGYQHQNGGRGRGRGRGR